MSKKVLLMGFIMLTVMITGCGKKIELNNQKKILYNDSAFFLQNNEQKYALFAKDGKQITKFVFSGATELLYGSAIVTDEKGNKGIIDEKGKMIVPIDKNNYIYRRAGLYNLTNKDYNDAYINAKGKIITKSQNADLNTYYSDEYSVLEENGKYYVLNYNGKKMFSFPVVENEEKDISVASEYNYLIINYAGKSYLSDIYKGKKLLQFNTDLEFCINQTNALNSDQVIIASCTSWGVKNNSSAFKFISKGKVAYENDNVCQNMYFEDNNVICVDIKTQKKYLMDKKGNKTLNLTGISYIDAENYAKNIEENDYSEKVGFYKNNKLIKTTDSCWEVLNEGYAYSDIYLLRKNCGSYKRQFYKSDGTSIDNVFYLEAEEFDKNGLAEVSVVQGKYFMINSKGKKVTNEYKQINKSYYGNYYSAVTLDNKKVVFDTKGVEFIKGNYVSIREEQIENKIYFILESDSKYTIYDYAKKKNIVTLSSVPGLNNNYISVFDNKGTSYYNFNGKKFYELKK